MRSMHPLPTESSPDVAARAATVAVLPVGSFEQHGDHLPLITDTAIACLIAQRLADDHALLLLPPLTLSCSATAMRPRTTRRRSADTS
jgi:creatinine amidohydrolase